MRNLILVTYSFPPENNIGALRPRGLAKYLPFYGWEVFVITPVSVSARDPRYNVFETLPNLKERLDYRRKKQSPDFNRVLIKPPFFKQILFSLFEIIPFPDSKGGWVFYGVYTGKHIIKQKKIDAIISTYSPASSHLIAHKLKKLYPEIKWIADFRDLWSHNPFHVRNRINQFFIEKMEKKILSNVDILTTVSEPLAQQLKTFLKKETFIIPNGFDPEDYDFDSKIDDKFSITYTGSLYSGERNPEMFFIALRKILQDDNTSFINFEVNFYCKHSEILENMIKKYNLMGIVKQNGIIPKNEVIKKQKSSQILLLLNRNLAIDRGVYTGKLFEYLGARRPILATGYRESVVKDLLEETGAGVYCYEQQQIYEALKNWYKEWKIHRIVHYKGKEEKIMLYSHKKMAEKFAMLLEKRI